MPEAVQEAGHRLTIAQRSASSHLNHVWVIKTKNSCQSANAEDLALQHPDAQVCSNVCTETCIPEKE